jgi:hypothetical protein
MRRILFFGLSGAFLAALSRLTFVDLDLFHEMALIREAWKIGFLPRVDIFSYIPTISPVVHHEWGAAAIFYLITVQLGLGAQGLMALKYLLSASIAIGCYRFSVRQGGGNYVFSYLAIVGLGLGWGGFTTIRAQLFTLFFLMIFLFLVEEDRKGNNWALWAWLPFYLIWLNVHGGFLVGLGLLAIYTSEKFFMNFITDKSFSKSFKMAARPLLFFLASCLLIPVNPYGTDYLPYLWNAIIIDRAPYFLEWRPLWKVSWGTLSLFSLSLGVVLYCIYKNELRKMPGLFILAAIAWLSLWHFRHLSLYGLVWTCYAPAYLEKTPFGSLIGETMKRNSRSYKAIFLIIGIMGSCYAIRNQFWKLRIPTTAEENKEGVPVYPAGAVAFLRDSKFSGNVMVPFNTGAYVSWNLYPEVKVSMDSRFEVAYPLEAAIENMRFYAADQGWRETLTKYRTDVILVPRWCSLDEAISDNGAGIHNSAPSGWQLVYIDDGYSLYMRSDLAKRFPLTDLRGTPIISRFP